MSDDPHPMVELLREDPRYTIEAYNFVREALGYAQDVLKLGSDDAASEENEDILPIDPEKSQTPERHITGQQLCEAIREYALEQYGYMAKVVLGKWGLKSTSDFGEIVYNLIGIGWMKKSEHDNRKDFDNAYDFDEAFRQEFRITLPDLGE